MDANEAASRTDVLALSARIRELEAQIVRLPGGSRLEDGGTNCTDCGSNCTNCGGDRLREVLMPGELTRLSGGELVKRLQAGGGNK